MTIFGKPLSEYVSFAKVFLVVVFVVGVLRLALSLAGLPDSAVWWISLSGAVWLGAIYYAIRVHTAGFGSYKQLLPIVFLLNLVSQAISILAIVIAIFTGVDNVFTVPEAAFGEDGKVWPHVAGHLFVGTTVGTLVLWLVGSLFMFVAKRVAPRNPRVEPAN